MTPLSSKDLIIFPAIFLLGIIMGATIFYTLEKMQIEKEHEWDIKCYFPSLERMNATTMNIPIVCYAPFFSSKTTLNLTLIEEG